MKKAQELEKIITDLKSQRDMLMRQLEQMKKEKDAANEKFEKLKQELELIRIKMREEYTLY